ncbi:NAD(P)H-binding protein [Microbacterium awajiense]|uniref:NAD(P)H-binding protein n=1 Tax=Microbacterium awajiense TaxID=415214 RepID=A0ABP7AXD0_9MICO
MRIAVAGGTGMVGAHVVELARHRDHDAVVLARSHGVDLISGIGLGEALAGVDVVIDVSNVSTLRTDASVSFFAGAAKSLLTAERAAGIGHHVALSIVGADAAPEGYYAGKLVQERLIEAGEVPWTILRATQFHEFAAMLYVTAKVGSVRVAPRGRLQPIAAREVAAHLLDLAEGKPVGRAAEIAGPREESLTAMVRTYASAVGYRRRIPSVALPGALGRAQRDGSLLPGPGAILGHQTFDQWIDALPDA